MRAGNPAAPGYARTRDGARPNRLLCAPLQRRAVILALVLLAALAGGSSLAKPLRGGGCSPLRLSSVGTSKYGGTHRTPRGGRCAGRGHRGARARRATTQAPGMFGIAAGGGLQGEDPPTMGRDLDLVQAAGADWLRVDINWAQIQAAGPLSFNWSNIDAVVNGAQSRGMKILGLLVYTPSWARPPGSSATFAPDPDTYAGFVNAAVAHYAALGVHAYEVWNEPNDVASWSPKPDVAAYTRLLKAADVAIKAEDPQATVVTGGTAPAKTDGTDIAPSDFLAGIYANGGQGYFDAVGHHPYCWPAYPGDALDWSAWYQMYGTSASLRSVMAAHGDGGKRIWATEFGAPTRGPGVHVSEAAQAEMVRRAYDAWAQYTWGGPLFYYQGRDDANVGGFGRSFGLATMDFSLKPAFGAYQQAARGG